MRLTRLVDVAAGAVAVDEGFTRARMRSLALSLRHLKFRDVRFMTAPHAGAGWSPDGRQSIVNLDHSRLAPLADASVTDSVGEYLERHEEDVVTLGGWVE
ncbi:hypothetical protein PU560_06250 [Georgenia sp. 10Sc9-8]|uniref:Uncharacterized protein n=1 Tax=Georgenia halotolerans TaxID=3028317 RepID=A0ABT5TVI5_9MICO|nr:hypothetical protein [Georgenia halotolerans]